MQLSKLLVNIPAGNSFSLSFSCKSHPLQWSELVDRKTRTPTLWNVVSTQDAWTLVPWEDKSHNPEILLSSESPSQLNMLFHYFSGKKKQKPARHLKKNCKTSPPRKRKLGSQRHKKCLNFAQSIFSPHVKCYSVLKQWLREDSLLIGNPLLRTWCDWLGFLHPSAPSEQHSHITLPRLWWHWGSEEELIITTTRKCQHLFFHKN